MLACFVLCFGYCSCTSVVGHICSPLFERIALGRCHCSSFRTFHREKIIFTIILHRTWFTASINHSPRLLHWCTFSFNHSSYKFSRVYANRSSFAVVFVWFNVIYKIFFIIRHHSLYKIFFTVTTVYTNRSSFAVVFVWLNVLYKIFYLYSPP